MKKLNFGCGREIRKGWDNCDIQKEAPISFDFDKFPYPLKDDYYDYICIKVVLGYLLYPEMVLFELWKKCKNGAIIDINCAFWNNVGAFNLLISKRGFSEKCFYSLKENGYDLNRSKKFEIASLELIPTKVGKCIYPKKLRNKLSNIFCGIFSNIYVKLRVVK